MKDMGNLFSDDIAGLLVLDSKEIADPSVKKLFEK